MARVLTAAGFVLFCEKEGRRRYLLLQNARHGAWGFPKGHSEKGESLLQTARRETIEETGISDFKIVRGFRVDDSYEVRGAKRGDYLKRVSYFLARARRAKHAQSDEHSNSAWLGFKDALKRLKYPALRRTLREAQAYLAKAAQPRHTKSRRA